MAKENSETIAETIKETLKEFAELENIYINKLLVQLTSMMSDRSSVMKKTNAIIDDWRTLKLSDLNETEIKKLKLFYCAAHVLLGFYNEITKSLKELVKHGHSIGKVALPKFSRFKHNSEPSAIRLIRYLVHVEMRRMVSGNSD